MQITSGMSQLNIFRGCLVAPMAAPVATLLVGPLFDREISFLHAPLIFVGVLVPAYLAMIVIALPLALLLQKLGRLTAGIFIASFVSVSALLALIAVLNGVMGFHRSDATGFSVLTGCVAAIVSLVWCLAAGVQFRRKAR